MNAADTGSPHRGVPTSIALLLIDNALASYATGSELVRALDVIDLLLDLRAELTREPTP